jgi:MYXO-CTERM domain-containing protein
MKFTPTVITSMFAMLSSSQAALLVNSAAPITHELRVQPIIVQQAGSEGGDIATYFGIPSQQAEIESYVDVIWAQAGIDVTFLSATSWVSSFAYNGYPEDYTSTMRPTVDLSTLTATGPLNPDPTVLNMFFVEIVPGFSSTSLWSSNGLAFLDANGVTMFVGSNLLTFTTGLEGIAGVVAHEIGHNLGLDHSVEAQNLLAEGGSPDPGHRISAAQIATVFTNGAGADGYDLLIPVPEPAAAVLGVIALGLAGLRRRR